MIIQSASKHESYFVTILLVFQIFRAGYVKKSPNLKADSVAPSAARLTSDPGVIRSNPSSAT